MLVFLFLISLGGNVCCLICSAVLFSAQALSEVEILHATRAAATESQLFMVSIQVNATTSPEPMTRYLLVSHLTLPTTFSRNNISA